MPPHQSLPKELFAPSWGFYFGKITILDREEAAVVILAFIRGNSLNEYYEGWQAEFRDAKGLVDSKMLKFFDLLNSRADMYIQLRVHLVFFEVVAPEFATILYSELSPAILHRLAVLFSEARRNWRASQRGSPTRLMEAVDAWIRAQERAASLPPLQTFSLPVR